MILSNSTLPQMLYGEVGAAYIRAGVEADNVLLRGFTSVRDFRGNSFGLKETIDAAVIQGPGINDFSNGKTW